MRPFPLSVRRASLWLSPLLIAGLAAAGSLPSVGDLPTVRTSAAPSVHHCYGKVVRVEDGDTVDIRLTKSCVDGARGSLMVIRNAGIQTTEHNNGHLECWAAEAERHFRHMLFRGRHVRTTSYYTTKSDRVTPQGRVRLIKYVDAARKGGKWLDVQDDQVLHGLAMAKPEDRESMRNAKMVYAMERAMRSRLGMWGSPQHCGTHHYAPNGRLRGWIGWKVDGPDGKDVNGEWLRFRNVGSTTINLARWKLRSSSHDLGGGPNKTYVPLPAGAQLAPGDTMTVYPGNGTDNVAAMKFYLNLPRLPFFRNVPMPFGESVPGTHLPTGKAWPGVGLYLVDPNLNFRSWAVYPCVVRCSWPKDVAISRVDPISPTGPSQKVILSNSSRVAADLTGVVMEYNGRVMEFHPGFTIPGGGSVTIHVNVNNPPPNTSTDLYWSLGTINLRNAGGMVWLRTWDDVNMSVKSWGDGGDYHYHSLA